MTEEQVTLPPDLQLSVKRADEILSGKQSRTVLKVELPPGSGPMTRKQRQMIKAAVRKKVKEEKKKAKMEMIRNARISKTQA